MSRNECKWFPVCPMKYYSERGLVDMKFIRKYCRGGGWEHCIRYQKEEAGIPHPDNLLPDGVIDENLS